MAFPVTCPACGKAFQLASDIYERKVAGKIVSIKCKQCHAGIRVDATEPGTLKVVGATPAGGSGDLSVGPKLPEAPKPATATAPNAPPNTGAKPAAAAAAAPMRMRQPTLIGMTNPNAGVAKPAAAPAPRPAAAPAPRPAAAPAPKPAQAPTPALWAVDSGGMGEDRELSEEEIRRELQAGNIGPQTLAWRDGMGEWLEIGQIPELKAFLEATTPEAPPPTPRAPERPALPKTRDFQQEPDAEATMIFDRSAPNASFEPFAAPEQEATARARADETAAPAEAPPPPPLPAAGRPAFAKTTPLADAPPPPLPLPARPAPPAQPPLPPPPAARPPMPLQPVGAAQAAPPVRPPMPAPPVQEPPAAPPLPKPAAPALAGVPWGDALPSAKPAVPALPTVHGPDPFAVAATTDLDFPQARSKKPLVIAVVVGIIAVIGIGIAVMSSGSAPATIAPPPPAPAATTPAETPKPAEPTPPSEPARNDSNDPAAPPTPPQAPSGDFSDLFSKGAEKAKGSGSGTKPFDEAAARASLGDILKAAAACKEVGGPTGQTSATVTFEPGGSVSGVTVGAPFAGSSTGTCIVTAFKRARVAPFTGLPGTVTQSISLR